MIADGARPCFQCSSVFEFAGGQLEAVRWSTSPCPGCERWHGILMLAKQRADEKPAPEEKPAAVDLTSLSAIHERVMAGLQRRDAEPFDHAKAAAGDRD